MKSPSGLILSEGASPLPQQPQAQSMSSLEAAALILSNGQTKDPKLASMIANAPEIDFDASARAGLRRQMGFDFDYAYNGRRRVEVRSTEGPRVTAVAKFNADDIGPKGEMSAHAIEQIVAACLRLKDKWDKANADDDR